MTVRKYFVFDLDNTLVKTNRANNEAYREAIQLVMGNDIIIKENRFTRNSIRTAIPDVSSSQIYEIVQAKEVLYPKHITETKVNKELIKCLVILHKMGAETVLLTECHQKRARQICDYYAFTQYFTKKFFHEDYNGLTKYDYFKKQNVSFESVVLFENEQKEIRRAVKNGISENQIISIKF